MEQSNKVERSEVWYNIYEVLARLDLKEAKGDCLDRPSAATEIEHAVKKLLPIPVVVGQSELLKTADCLNALDGWELCKKQCERCKMTRGF